MFLKYQKIHRLGAEENDGILIGTCIIEEKIDGANTSIWMEDGTIRMGSRTQDLTSHGLQDEKAFNGFCKYVFQHQGINNYLRQNPTHRLYGEWLVRHTVQYKETAYKQWYLFDIHDGEKFLSRNDVRMAGLSCDMLTPYIFAEIENPTPEQIMEFVGRSSLGEKGEGIVIKNENFRNKFGDMEYAKIVTQSFKEDNAVVFGGNNKHSDTYWEVYVMQKYVTLERVRKLMNKIEPTLPNGERFDMKHIPRIMETVYHDVLTEEIYEIAKKVPKIDFKELKRMIGSKAKKIYVDVLNDFISVAYTGQKDTANITTTVE